jgi:hypothetical protein
MVEADEGGHSRAQFISEDVVCYDYWSGCFTERMKFLVYFLSNLNGNYLRGSVLLRKLYNSKRMCD